MAGVVENFRVSSLFGAKTKQGLVQVEIGENFNEMWSILDTKKIAYMLLEAAEGALLDQTVYRLFEKIGYTQEQATELLLLVRQARNETDPHFYED